MTGAPETLPPPPLRTLRRPAGPLPLEAGAAVLGGLAWGEAPAGAAGAALLGLPLLHPAAPVHDLFGLARPLHGASAGDRGAPGAAPGLWTRTDGHWLFGGLDLDEPASGLSLEALARQAYLAVFERLAAQGVPHLLRVWNYLPDIHGLEDGLERYRRFNLGRQAAFVEAGQAAFEGAPAACALGTQGRTLSLRFLAARHLPLAIENPRQVSAYRYPRDYGPAAPSFSRASLFDAGGGAWALGISGTASIVGHQSLHPGDVVAQTEETLRNLQAVVEAARAASGMGFQLADFDATVYLRRAADQAAVERVLADTLGPASRFVRERVVLRADICRDDLLLEIEAFALAGGPENQT